MFFYRAIQCKREYHLPFSGPELASLEVPAVALGLIPTSSAPTSVRPLSRDEEYPDVEGTGPASSSSMGSAWQNKKVLTPFAFYEIASHITRFGENTQRNVGPWQDG